MTDAFTCDTIRTPFGRHGGALALIIEQVKGSQ
jgi:hypothetical protein